VRRLRCAVVVFGIYFVALSSIVPRVDSPETAYDESDAPVNLTTPLVARTNLVMPTGHFVVIPREQRVSSERATARNVVTLRPGMCISHSLLTFLCTLLC
jgi:hypothetical protein